MGYYSLIKLIKGTSFFEQEGNIIVNLDKADLADKIGDDLALSESISEDLYFWVSGGGTYLLNNRYIVVVKRNDIARINPNKFSLFTGRASGMEECVNPKLLVRELFEELILFFHDKPYYPQNKLYQNIIDIVYHDLSLKFNLSGYLPLDLHLEEMGDIGRSITLIYSRMEYPLKLTYHINGKNDINILFIFSCAMDSAHITAQDGEYHVNNRQFIKHNRSIYLYDLITSKARCINAGKQQPEISITERDMTEHLLFTVRLLERKLTASNDN